MSASNSGMPVQSGAISGGLAWIVALVVTYILLEVGVMGGAAGSMIASSFAFVVALFSGLHLWPLLFNNQMSVSLLWVILPIAVLLVSGYYVADRYGGGAQTGAAVTVGYFALSLLSVIYLVATFGQIDIVQMIAYLIIGGVVFPIVFGGIGGMLAEEM
jgi:hypothetical protein